MKVHKQSVMIEAHMGYIEVVSFFETDTKTYGADIYFEDNLTETVSFITNEPMREHLLSLGYHFILSREKKQAG